MQAAKDRMAARAVKEAADAKAAEAKKKAAAEKKAAEKAAAEEAAKPPEQKAKEALIKDLREKAKSLGVESYFDSALAMVQPKKEEPKMVQQRTTKKGQTKKSADPRDEAAEALTQIVRNAAASVGCTGCFDHVHEMMKLRAQQKKAQAAQ